MARAALLTALVAGVAAAGGVLVTLGWTAAAHLRYRRYHRRHGLPGLEWRGREVVRYYLGSLRAVALAGAWQLAAGRRRALHVPAGGRRGPAVLCVHGFLMNDTSLWGLRRALAAAGRPSRAVFLGRPHRRLEDYLPPLLAALEQLIAASPGERVDVVCHSMGGLVVRLALARRPDLAARLRRIVTLGTPHGGTPVSHSLPVGPEVRQMGLGSTFLATLPGFAATAPDAAVITVAADPDLVVYPAGAAHLPGSRRLQLAGVSHLGLLSDPRAIATVVAALEAPS